MEMRKTYCSVTTFLTEMIKLLLLILTSPVLSECLYEASDFNLKVQWLEEF